MPVSGVSARGGEKDPRGVGGGASVGGGVGVASTPGVGPLVGLSIGGVARGVDDPGPAVAVVTCVGGALDCALGCTLGVGVALVQATTSAATSVGRATRHFV